MINNYPFLIDHSYSLRPISDDNDEIELNQREQNKKKSSKIDQSSNNKENHSLLISNSTDLPLKTTKSPINKRSNRKKSFQSRRSRLSTRTTMKNCRKQMNKKTKNKTLNISQIDFNDSLTSLSIEERVKLRRTKLVQTKTTEKNIENDLKQIRQSIRNKRKTSKIDSKIKKNKSFLGSGLDLNNILLGNRQRRSVQT